MPKRTSALLAVIASAVTALVLLSVATAPGGGARAETPRPADEVRIEVHADGVDPTRSIDAIRILVVSGDDRSVRHRFDGVDVPGDAARPGDSVFAYKRGFDLGHVIVEPTGDIPVVRLARAAPSSFVLTAADRSRGAVVEPPTFTTDVIVRVPADLVHPDTSVDQRELDAFDGPTGPEFHLPACSGATTFVRASSEVAVVWPHWTVVRPHERHELNYRRPLTVRCGSRIVSSAVVRRPTFAPWRRRDAGSAFP